MSIFDYLATPAASGVVHALELLILAVVALVTAWTNRVSRGNRKRLNGHLRMHGHDDPE